MSTAPILSAYIEITVPIFDPDLHYTHLSLAFWVLYTGVASAFLSKLTSQTNPQPQSCSWPHNCLCKSNSSFKGRLKREAGHFLLWPPQPSEDPLSVLFIWPLSCLIVRALPSVFPFSLQIDGKPFKGRKRVHFVSSLCPAQGWIHSAWSMCFL